MRLIGNRRSWAVLATVALAAAAVGYIALQNRVKPGDPTGLPPLHAAVTLEDFSAVEDLLESGTPVDELGPEGNTPLHYARSKRMVELLLAEGADRDARNDDLELPLHTVRMPGAAEALLDAGADPNARDFRGETALHDAPGKKLVRILVKAGADVNAQDSYGMTPLHSAGNGGVVEALLKHGADPHLEGRFALTPLHYARDTKSVRALVRAGLSVGAAAQGTHPLHTARNAEVASALLALGADPNTLNQSGCTPLLQTRNPEVAGVLIQAGADLEAEYPDLGMTRLSALLQFQGNEEIAKLLLHNGAIHPDMEQVSMISDPEIVRLLLGRGCSHHKFSLALIPDAKLVQELIDHGAEVAPADPKAFKPLHWSPNAKVAEVLLAAGADPNTAGLNGATALIAITRRNRSNPTELQAFFDLLIPVTDFTAGDHLDAAREPWILKRFLAAGANPNNSALLGMAAASAKEESDRSYEILSILLEAGSNPNLSHSGFREADVPLLYHTTAPPVIELLLAHGADPTVRLRDGRSLLHNRDLSLEAFTLLVGGGADLEATDANGRTPLLHIARRLGGYASGVRRCQGLIELGANPNARDSEGRTALHTIAKKLGINYGEDSDCHCVDQLRYLLSEGADPKIRDANGKLAVDYCAAHQEAAALLANP